MPQEKFETVLPEDFDGTFRFTNWTDSEFVGKWGGVEYRFPPNKRSPMLISNATPLETQQIRKKFARELAEAEFFKSDKAKAMTEKRGELNSIHQANTYSDRDLSEYIQRCLEPLPTGKADVRMGEEEPLENKLTRTPKGKLRTRVLGEDESLIGESKNAGDE